MPITKKLVEKMGGTISFESKEGTGTTFVIRIPFQIDTDMKDRNETEEKTETSIQGLHVLLTEDNELNMEIAEFVLQNEGADVTKACRVQLANTAGANLFVSIHCNTSDAWDTSANGLECLYATNKKALAAKNKKLAKTILHSLTKTTRLKKRGVIKRNGLYILRKAKIPSTIVEVGYLSNKKDLKTIIKESGQNAIAQGISDGIIQALEGNR